MIIVVDGLNRHLFSEVLDEMFELRARVFGGRLGWDVNIQDGKEIDEFDNLDPAYVIGLDDGGNVVAAVRALQTTGPHMLSDVFSAILCGEAPIRSATMWESTRFCVDTQRLNRGKDKNSVSYATCELMIGSLEYAKNAGISDIITVIDPVMDRVLKRSNCAPYDYVGETVRWARFQHSPPCLIAATSVSQGFATLPGFTTMCSWTKKRRWPCSRPRRPRTATRRTATTSPLTDLEKYFVEQMNAAKTEAERQDVLRLIESLTDTFTPEQKTALLHTPRAFAHEA